MKTFILTWIFVICALGVADISGQTRKRLDSTPPAFQTFYAKFRNAVVRGDKQAVEAMTEFPFDYGWDAGDEGTYTRRQFLAKFNDIFGDKKIFRQKNPLLYVQRNSFDLMDESDASHYGFTKTRAGYKFTSMIVEP